MATGKQETTERETSEHETTDHVAQKLHKVIDKAASSVEGTEERIRKEAGDVADKVRENTEYAQVSAEELIRTVTAYTRSNPLIALGIAFVAGSIFSALTGRR